MSDPEEPERVNGKIRGREQYDAFENYVALKRAKLSNPLAAGSDEAVNEVLYDLDFLYTSHTSGTANTVLIDADQRVFRSMVEALSERMKRQARGVPGEITAESLMTSIAQQSSARGPPVAMLEAIGALFNRGSRVAPLPPALPTLSKIHANEPRGPRAQAERMRTDTPEEAGTVGEDDFPTEKIHNRTQTKILASVRSDEEVNEYEPLLLYRLCFDKHSFVRTLENFFAVCALIKEQKLWIGANERGLPVIGSVDNRPHYLKHHPKGFVCGPDRNTTLPVTARESTVQEQFNLNFNYELYELQKNMFGEEDPMVKRNDYDESVE